MQKHHSIARSRGGSNDSWNILEKTDYDHTYDHAVDFVLFENAPTFDFRLPAWSLLPEDLREAVLLEKSNRNKLHLHGDKNDDGKSTHALRCLEIIHEKKNDEGKSVVAVAAANALHTRKDERGKSVVGVRSGRKAAKITNSQKWKCTITGFVSTVGGLNSYQKHRGIDFKNRIRVQ